MNHKRAKYAASHFMDTCLAEQFFTAMLKGMKPCRHYYDDPENDKASPYLKGIIAIRDVAIKIIETSKMMRRSFTRPKRS